MRVLLVEDDPSWADAVTLMLREEGHACRTAGLGEEAVALATHQDFDLIILDILLPDLDGYEVIERLHAAGLATPILIQSGLVKRHDEADARAFGVDDIIIKPFDRDELARRLQSAAGLAEGGDQRPRDRRKKRIKPARMILGDGAASCMVLNLSGGGAALRLPRHLSDCPPVFTLELDTGRVHRCRVCWRVGDKVGVKFLAR